MRSSATPVQVETNVPLLNTCTPSMRKKIGHRFARFYSRKEQVLAHMSQYVHTLKLKVLLVASIKGIHHIENKCAKNEMP